MDAGRDGRVGVRTTERAPVHEVDEEPSYYKVVKNSSVLVHVSVGHDSEARNGGKMKHITTHIPNYL